VSGEYERHARDIAAAVLGRDPGPLTAAESDSHHVYVGPDVVVKVIDAARHSRLDREIALAPQLPAGLAAPLLASGLWPAGAPEVRYACYIRVRGTTPGMGMPGVNGATARLLAEQATQWLGELHRWVPAGGAEQTLREPPDDGGFVGRAALLAAIDNLAAIDRGGVVSARLLSGLTAIAERAPLRAQAAVPVHADCHWGNWLACDQRVTALLDFEWARFGEPADDWFFLIRFSGEHREAVLDVVARATTIPGETLRAESEVREASYLVSDIRSGLERPGAPPPATADRLAALDDLIIGRSWWRRAG
jgi:Phosphotransferase enzyme family